MAGSAEASRVRVWRILAALCLAYVAYLALLFVFQRDMVFPGTERDADPAAFDRVQRSDPHAQRTWFTASGTRSEAWLLPAHGDRPRAPAVLFAHGNYELIDDWAVPLSVYRRLGLHVLLVEYPGYGRSKGAPSAESISAVFQQAVSWLQSHPGVDRERIVFHGRSVGGGPICDLLGSGRAPAAVVLQSTFTSLAAMARPFGAPSFLVRDPFDCEARVAGYSGPLLVTHGRLDEVVPVSHAYALRDAAGGEASLVLQDCGHNNCALDEAELAAFLSRSGVLTHPPE